MAIKKSPSSSNVKSQSNTLSIDDANTLPSTKNDKLKEIKKLENRIAKLKREIQDSQSSQSEKRTPKRLR